ncbi:cell division protein ZapA [Chlamydiota bacterium]
MATNTGTLTTVTIFNKEYSIVSDLRPQYLVELAACVDEKMREIAQDETLIPHSRLVMLTLLHIMDELSCLKQQKKELISLIDSKVSQIIENIDGILVQQ